MTTVTFPYGKEHIRYDFQNEELSGVLTSSVEAYVPLAVKHNKPVIAFAGSVDESVKDWKTYGFVACVASWYG